LVGNSGDLFIFYNMRIVYRMRVTPINGSDAGGAAA
jgi:hypothetical protein